MSADFAANEHDARAHILRDMNLTPQTVWIAKGIVFSQVNAGADSSTSMIDSMASRHGVSMPPQLNLHKAFDSTAALRAAAEVITWRVCTAEAILSLVHAGEFVPLSKDYFLMQHRIRIFVGYPGSGGHGSDIEFPELSFFVPSQVRVAPSIRHAQKEHILDPDLYLHNLGIPAMHLEVESALRESVRCFRHDLFAAAVVMLGKASEGAWTELGESLLRAIPANKTQRVQEERKTFEDWRWGMPMKIAAITALVEKDDVFGAILALADIKPKALKYVAQWSDLVRDSRNTIHFRKQSATADTYEKVAALLLGATPSLRILYGLKSAADQSPPAAT